MKPPSRRASITLRLKAERELRVLLFITEAPSVGTADFDAEEGFRVVTDCRFRTMAIVLRRRGSSRRSLATAWKIKQATGSARPQVAHNFALSCRWLSCESLSLTISWRNCCGSLGA